MAELQKAKLQEVKADKNQKPIGVALPVQFNPGSLRLKLTNQSSGGRSRGNQRRQNNGQGSTVLSMDLVFDSADEGSEGTPVSVRNKTNIVERFVLPKERSSEAPPLLRFEWDKLIIVGIVESLDINFEHFASNGAPLRAKMSLSIKEQNPKYAYLKLGKGKKDSDAAKNSGGNKSAPGSGTNEQGGKSSNSDRSDTALDGESAAEFLARQGLDPNAWRGLDVDLSAGLSLQAGVEVGFSANLSTGLGIGVSAGISSNTGVSLEASLGIGASAVLTAGAGGSVGAAVSAGLSSIGGANKAGVSHTTKVSGNDAGKALSAAGGIRSAIETVKTKEIHAITSAAQTAFGLLARGDNAGLVALAFASRATAAGTSVSYSPLAASQKAGVGGNLPAAGGNRMPANAINLPRADPRSTSYGYGVPLEPLYAAALTQGQVRLCPRNESGLRADDGPNFRQEKTTPPWVALPRRDKTRALADQKQTQCSSRNCQCHKGS